MYAGASSPRAEVVSFASLSVPLLRMALRRASARAAADIVVGKRLESEAGEGVLTVLDVAKAGKGHSVVTTYCLSPIPENNIQKTGPDVLTIEALPGFEPGLTESREKTSESVVIATTL